MAYVRTKRRGQRLYYYLVESKREGGKVRQRGGQACSGGVWVLKNLPWCVKSLPIPQTLIISAFISSSIVNSPKESLARPGLNKRLLWMY